MIISDNGFVIYYYRGRIDNWCVYVLKSKNKGLRWTPKDKEYFRWLQVQGKKYGNDKVYEDFLKLYDVIDKDTSFEEVVNITREINKGYPKKFHYWWVILALTLIAEENKKFAPLGKKVKLLGVYNILKEGYSVAKTTQYMKGMKWYELEDLLIERGLNR